MNEKPNKKTCYLSVRFDSQIMEEWQPLVEVICKNYDKLKEIISSEEPFETEKKVGYFIDFKSKIYDLFHKLEKETDCIMMGSLSYKVIKEFETDINVYYTIDLFICAGGC